jgi:hypothetical protein
MSNDQDYVERVRDAPPRVSVEEVEAARAPNTASWWIAAVVAIVAVVGAIYFLSGAQPSPAKLQAAHDRGVAEAQIDDAAYGSQLAVAHAAKSAEAAAASRARATETAARAAANSADATAQNTSATEAAPPP